MCEATVRVVQHSRSSDSTIIFRCSVLCREPNFGNGRRVSDGVSDCVPGPLNVHKAGHTLTCVLMRTPLTYLYARRCPPTLLAGSARTQDVNMAAAVGTAVSLAGAFGLPTGVKDVRNLVRSFDYSKLSVVSSENQEYLKVDLAPAFGKLDSDSIKLMDEKLKIMISGTTTAIARLEDKSWANVVATLTQNPLLEPIGDEVHRNDKLMKNGTNTFKFDGSAEQDIVREVETWFKKLVEGMWSRSYPVLLIENECNVVG